MILRFKFNEFEYELRPQTDGCCWRIWEKPLKAKGRNGKPIKNEWCALDVYPRDLHRGVKKIVELILMKQDGTVKIDCTDCTECELKKLLKSMGG